MLRTYYLSLILHGVFRHVTWCQEWDIILEEVPIADERLHDLKRATAADPTLQKIRLYVQNGWPISRHGITPNVSPFYSFRNELSY